MVRGMTGSSFIFLRIRGIPIGAHWSWLFVFGLVVWSLASSLFPATYPGLSDTSYLVMGVVAGALFFISILLHELGHAFRALREGLTIDGITLWLFGGVARFKGIFPSAGAEFRIAIAGPLVSVAITVVFAGLTALGEQGGLGWSEQAQGIVDYLWRINAIVVAFNMIPALPLDGGRVLRAWLWHRQESFPAATVSAARAGKAFGGLLAAVGLLNFFSGGGGAGGLWFVFLGWFLIQAAESETEVGLMQTALRGCRVADLMTDDPQVVDADISLDRFLDEATQTSGPSTYPVLRAGELVGMISQRAVVEVPSNERAIRTVAEAMIPRSELTILDPEADVVDVLEDLQKSPRRAPVMDDGTLVGILSVSDVVRLLETERVRTRRAEKPRRRRGGILAWLVVGGIMLGAAGYFYQPPFVVVGSGITLDVIEDVEISGVSTDTVNGKYLLTSVSMTRPNGWGLVWAAVRDREIASASEVTPEGIDEETFLKRQREIFRQSRILAAAAGAEAAGLDVTVGGSGAIVEQVLPGSPAARELEEGDVIVAVNGREIKLSTDLQDMIRSRSVKTRFRIEFERNGRTQEVELRSRRLSGAADGAVGIGVVILTRGFDIDLPFEIEFERRQIGGPSAGLIYALAITDMLDGGDPLKGRTVAATGTIDVEGNVGPIGGADLKARGAAHAGATLFLVPERDVDTVSEDGLRTVGVSTLEQALKALSTTS
jgi:PDZ domain-containing secreted protein/Zn-dependent protease/CBS domain-containing protein